MKDTKETTKEPTETDTAVNVSKRSGKYKKPLKAVGLAALLIVAVLGSYVGYLYTSTPSNIRKPAYAHYHFRMQLLVNGKAEDFGGNQYQREYPKDICSANLPEQPIHFHDGKNQFVHIHWQGITGGQVLKYFGWNFTGGMDNTLGYRFDNLPKLTTVKTEGKLLPERPAQASYYIYTGDKDGYKERDWDEFISKDLEVFFGKNYDIKTEDQQSFFEKLLVPKANAQAKHTTGHSDTATDKTEEELTRINTLVGNVVIFAQKDKPSDEQVKERFNQLVPLGLSACGG